MGKYSSINQGKEDGILTLDSSFSFDFVFVKQAICGYLMIKFQSGRDLALLASNCETYVPQISKFGKDMIAFFVKLIHQTALNLMSATDDFCSLKRGVTSDLDEKVNVMGKSEGFIKVFYSYAFRLYATFGEYQAGAKHALEHGDSKKIRGRFPSKYYTTPKIVFSFFF